WRILIAAAPECPTAMRPVTVLRDYSITFRAALKACSTHPSPKRIHTLRTSTRRIEAILKLLSHLNELPSTAREATRFHRAARPIRQAAGAVRDADVLLTLLAHLPSSANQTLASGIAHLAAKLERRRKRAAQKLATRIADKGEHLLNALDALELALAPASAFTIATAGIDRIARETFRHAAVRSTPPSLAASEDALHSLRKSAKLTRYLAESAASSSRAKPSLTAQRFQAAQKKIGAWHDWLLLADFAGKHLHSGHPLLAVLRKREARTRVIAIREAGKLL
ncbi:MAG: CHAD domain-containing protein, partial [Acidobacteriaceae bacterium]|nr:CHAD domain-containing protein [Acidobacteriaceae bacterium]